MTRAQTLAREGLPRMCSFLFAWSGEERLLPLGEMDKKMCPECLSEAEEIPGSRSP